MGPQMSPSSFCLDDSVSSFRLVSVHSSRSSTLRTCAGKRMRVKPSPAVRTAPHAQRLTNDRKNHRLVWFRLLWARRELARTRERENLRPTQWIGGPIDPGWRLDADARLVDGVTSDSQFCTQSDPRVAAVGIHPEDSSVRGRCAVRPSFVPWENSQPTMIRSRHVMPSIGLTARNECMVAWHVRTMSSASAAAFLHWPITRTATATATGGNKERIQHDRPDQQYYSFFHTSIAEIWCGSNSRSNNNDRRVISSTPSLSSFSKGRGSVMGRRFQERASKKGGRRDWILHTVATATSNENINKSRRRYYHRLGAAERPTPLTSTPIAAAVAAAAAAAPTLAAVQAPAAIPTPPTPPPSISITTQAPTTAPPKRFFGPVNSTVAQKQRLVKIVEYDYQKQSIKILELFQQNNNDPKHDRRFWSRHCRIGPGLQMEFTIVHCRGCIGTDGNHRHAY
jgi:hypothetical protein